MTKKVSAIITIVIGIVIIGIGIVAMTVAPDPEEHATSYRYVQDAEFGADFYTYMYDASYKIVQQLNSIDRGFSDIAKAEAKTQQSIHTVGGLLMICFGLGVAAMGVNAMGQEPTAPVLCGADPVPNIPQTQPAAPRWFEEPAPVEPVAPHWFEEPVPPAPVQPEVKIEPEVVVATFADELRYALQFQTDEGMNAKLWQLADKEEHAQYRMELDAVLSTPVHLQRQAAEALLEKYQ